MSKLVMPKNSALIEEIKAVLKIYYEVDDWISNDFLKTELMKIIGDNQYSSSYTKKTQIPAYFGLIEWEDIKSNRSKRRITVNGKVFYEAMLRADYFTMNKIIIEALKNIHFGRNNFGANDSDSDIEAPGVFVRASYELNGLTFKEFGYLLYNLENCNKSYTESIRELIDFRNNNKSINLPDNANKYLDCKPIMFMHRIHFFEKISDKLLINKNYIPDIDNEIIDIKIFNPDKSNNYLANNKKEINNLKKTEFTGLIQGRNIIFYGSPGTGKSYNIKEFIINNGLKDYDDKLENPNVFRTTLHPEYSYHDFVGQVMPVVKDEKVSYEFTPQIFTNTLLRSLNVPNEPVFLIIEEMSRANVAAVFGDLFQLLDRDDFSESEYRIDNKQISEYINKEMKKDSLQKIYIPNNLFIIGTVNTSDQNVFVMDTAFKRRFEFEYIDANKMVYNDNKDDFLNNYEFSILNQKYKWIEFIKALNKFIVSEENKGLALSEDKQLGQFFIKFKIEKDGSVSEANRFYNDNQIKNKLLQYLWNDIKGASYSEITLFHKNINSFSEAYACFDEKNNNKPSQFFSDEFNKFLEEGISNKRNISEMGGVKIEE